MNPWKRGTPPPKEPEAPRAIAKDCPSCGCRAVVPYCYRHFGIRTHLCSIGVCLVCNTRVGRGRHWSGRDIISPLSIIKQLNAELT